MTTIYIGPDPEGAFIQTDSAVIYEHDDLNGTLAAALSMKDAAALMDAWKAQDDDVHREWTFPDTDGDYDGAVLATADYDGVSLAVWDARNMSKHADDDDGMLIFTTWDFPFVVTIVTEED